MHLHHCAIAFILAQILCAPAADAAVGHTRISHYSVSYQVEANGGYVRIEDVVSQALDAEGVNALGQTFFQDGKPSLEILAAETILASGEKIAVAASAIQRQKGILGQTLASTDKDLIRITFPKLAPGAAIHYRVKSSYAAKHDKQFAVQSFFSESLPWDSADITLDAPEKLALRFDEVGVRRVSEQSEGGRRKLHWHWSNPDTRIAPLGELSNWIKVPHLIVSSYTDWKQIADSYARQAESRATVTPEVRALADSLTSGVEEPREQVRRLYDWVRDNIRYTALWSGDENFVPHEVSVILKNRWGDCKDHATLLQSLLKAKGIAAAQVLIRSDYDSFALPALPIGAYFNHVINYLPSLDLYLDSTVAKVPFGLLPDSDQGKPVLLSQGYSPSSRTPFAGDNLARVIRDSRIMLREDGSAQIQTKITGQGSAAINAREFIDHIGHKRLDEWATHEISVAGHEGHASLAVSPESDPHRYSYILTEEIHDFLKQPDAASLRFSHAQEGPIAISRILSRFHDSTREREFTCRPFAVEDSIEYRLPAALKILYLPRDVAIDEQGIHAIIRYEKEGNTIRALRSIRTETTSLACPASSYPTLQPVMQRLDKAMSAAFLIARTDALPRESCATVKPLAAKKAKRKS